jgi:hypothetical protein
LKGLDAYLAFVVTRKIATGCWLLAAGGVLSFVRLISPLTVIRITVDRA